MLAKRTGWIGVDIGTHTVKVAQLERDSRRHWLRHAVVIERLAGEGTHPSPSLRNPVSSRSEINSALQIAGGFRGTRTACMLPTSVCDVRGLIVPAGTGHERRAMIASEMADEWAGVNVPLEFDFWELDPAPEDEMSEEYNVMVATAPKPWVEQTAADCRRARISCCAIDAAPLAAARALQLLPEVAPRDRLLAVDWGFCSTTLCVASQGLALYTRQINDCGLREILNSIMAALDVSRDEAQHLIDVYGVLGDYEPGNTDADLQAAITEAASPTFARLLSELKRTREFLHRNRRPLSPSTIWMMGGGASIRNVDRHLSKQIDLPVYRWRLPTSSDGVADSQHRLALFGPAAALSALAWRTS